MKKSLLVYENDWILKKIYEVSDSKRNELVDQTKFEERCINKISKYLAGDIERLKNKNYIKNMIHKEAMDFVKRYKNECYSNFTELGSNTEDGEEIPFDPVDVLADVESEVLTKETTDLLAQGDRRKKLIVECWSDGNDNASQISRVLAHSFGGNTESYRKFVQRFQKLCREELSTAI